MLCGPEIMMRFTRPGAGATRPQREPDLGFSRAKYEVRGWALRSLPARRDFRLQGWPRVPLRSGGVEAAGEGALMGRARLAVWKFASCDGCQLSLLDCEDELLDIAAAVDIVHFLEASSHVEPGPYDLSIVEGSVTTPKDAARIQEIHAVSKKLITIGACATAGGIQALRNFGDHAEMMRAVYAKPEYIETLATSTPIAAHIPVDFELRGCPIDKAQLLEVIRAFLFGRKPQIRAHSTCMDCKARLETYASRSRMAHLASGR